MKAHTFTYSTTCKALEVNPFFMDNALEKNAPSEKNRVSWYRYGFNGMEKDDEVKGSGNHVDFGARGYDPRLGRWLSIDPKFRKYPFVSGYAFVVNSPIRFIDFNGEDFYDPTKSIQEKYQHTNTFLKNVKDYYNGSGDEKFAAIFDANFKAAFEKYSTLTKVDIQDLLEYGKGPVLDVHNLDVEGVVNTENKRVVNGVNLTYVDDNSKSVRTAFIVIDDNVAGDFERALFGLAYGDGTEELKVPGNSLTGVDAEKAIDSFVSTLFHESVHYGRNETGAGNPANEPEYGKEFEKEAYGRDVKRRTAPTIFDSDPSLDEK